jgi:hypothetical protein
MNIHLTRFETWNCGCSAGYCFPVEFEAWFSHMGPGNLGMGARLTTPHSFRQKKGHCSSMMGRIMRNTVSRPSPLSI